MFGPAIPEISAEPGLWLVGDGGVVPLERWDSGPAVALVPTEDVLLLAVDLPMAGRSQRRAALPFAVEDRIADPAETVHIVLGAPIGPPAHLAAVVRHEAMARWTEALSTAGLGHAQIVPDALLLPVPPPGSWNVAAIGDRIIVRTDEGTGFAVADDRFMAIWAAGGSLPCAVYGEALAVELPMMTSVGPAVDVARLAASPLDLRYGRYSPHRAAIPRIARRAIAVVGLGLLAHTAILAADAHKLAQIAATRRTATEALLHRMLPGTPLSADLDRLLPGDAGGRAPLLPLLVRAAAALSPVGGLGWSKLVYSARDNSVTIGLEAADIGGLQRGQAALAAAGLNPANGAVTAGSGRADGDVVIRSGG